MEDAMDMSRVFQVSIFFQGKLAQATESFSENRRIGGGGFGDVYMTSRGMTSRLGLGSLHDYVAIKKLNSASMQGQSEFLKEIQVQGGCRHENLLVLLGFSADNGVIQGRDGFCLVTPLMRGGSLQDRLVLDAAARERLRKLPEAPADGHTPLTWSQRLTVALGALSGLAYLHTPDPATQKPVVLHGDLKPANILLDFNLNPRLSDGGLARTLRPNALHASAVSSIAGTNGFLDEFYRNTGRYDVKSDAYSMGVTLLIILTGYPVFHERFGPIVRRCEVEASRVMTIADQSAQWPQEVAREMHKVAMALVIESDRDARMSVSNARDAVQMLVADHLPLAPVIEGMEVERVCVICMSEPRFFRFGECGHSVLCRGCMDDLMRRARPLCPNCRRPVSRQRLIQGNNMASEDTFVRPRAEAPVVAEALRRRLRPGGEVEDVQIRRVPPDIAHYIRDVPPRVLVAAADALRRRPRPGGEVEDVQIRTVPPDIAQAQHASSRTVTIRMESIVRNAIFVIGSLLIVWCDISIATASSRDTLYFWSDPALPAMTEDEVLSIRSANYFVLVSLICIWFVFVYFPCIDHYMNIVDDQLSFFS